MSIRNGLSCLVLTSCAVFAQPAFEVASVKAAPPLTGGHMMIGMGNDPGRVNYTNVSLRDVLPRAYGVKRYQIAGPSWLDSERFDIVAKVPENTPKEQIPAMLQTLLAERFKLKVHREQKELPIYALVVGKNGPKLEKAEDDGQGPGPGLGRGMMMVGNGRMEMKRATMSGFSDLLSNMLDRPVIDMTELPGSYNIALDVSMEEHAGFRGAMMRRMGPGPGGPGGPGPGEGGGAASDGAPAPSIFVAVQQLGLKLEPRKAPLEIIVVDDGDKVPTEN